jgi:hypothetical protein
LAGTSFTAYSYSNSTYAGAANVDYWANGQDTVPEVGKNVGGSNATCCSTVLIPPGVLWIHPGQSGDTDTIVQWTAPANGNYSYAGSFAILDTSPTGVIGEVFKNASALYSGVLTGPPASLSGTIGGSEPFGGTVSLNAGDVLSFAVNRNGNYSDDSTALTLTISTATPLPAALPLFASGLGAIGFVGWRRKRKRAHAVT